MSDKDNHDWRDCKIEDCNECQDLIDQGILMACDECDSPGHQNTDGWHLLADGKTLCDFCYKKISSEAEEYFKNLKVADLPDAEWDWPQEKDKQLEKERGHFTTKRNADGKLQFNLYNCEHCLKAGIEHEVRSVPHGQTDSHSSWGSGISTTRRECSVCERWDGPWVSTDIVGGGW